MGERAASAALLDELDQLAERHRARVDLHRRGDGLWTVMVEVPAEMHLLTTRHAPLEETLRRAIEFLDGTDRLDGLVTASKAGGPL